MAGIGFELKRIFKKDSLTSVLSGAVYSTVVVIGPTLIVMLTLLLLYGVLGYMEVPYADRELLSSAILYIFIFSVIIVTPINNIISRYVADRIFEDEFADILPSFYTGLLICEAIGAVVGIPFLAHVALVGKVEIVYVAIMYLFFVALITVFYTLTYLTATKDYKIVALDFFLGMIFAFVFAYVTRWIYNWELIYAVLTGLCLGFWLIAVLQVAYVKHYFKESNKSYGKCLSYFLNMKRLFFGSLFYVLGLYCHNFVFWGTEGRLVVAESFYTYQAYDMASCLGMFTNISAMVIFTVMSETKFHDIYQKYNEAIIGSTLRDIETAKSNMFRLLIQQIGYVVRIQVIISVIIFLLAIIFLPDMGFSGLEMTIYPSLAAAFFGIFTMYCNNIFLCYFNDSTGAFFTGFLFFAGTLIGSLVSCHLEPQFYGVGVLAGALIAWTYSYFRIRFLEKNFDYHIMCSMHVINLNLSKKPDSLIYKRK